MTLNTFYFSKPAIFFLSSWTKMVIWKLSWDSYEKNEQDNNHKLLNISLTYIETALIIIVVHTGIVVREWIVLSWL